MLDGSFPFIPSTAKMRPPLRNAQCWDEDSITSGIDLALQHLPLEAVGAIRWFIPTLDSDPVGLIAQPNR